MSLLLFDTLNGDLIKLPHINLTRKKLNGKTDKQEVSEMMMTLNRKSVEQKENKKQL